MGIPPDIETFFSARWNAALNEAPLCPSEERIHESGIDYWDVSVLSNFGPCLIWKRPSTVSQIQPE